MLGAGRRKMACRSRRYSEMKFSENPLYHVARVLIPWRDHREEPLRTAHPKMSAPAEVRLLKRVSDDVENPEVVLTD